MSPYRLATHLGQEKFLAEVLHRQYLHVPGAIGSPRSVMTWDTVNDIISHHRMEPPRMRLARDGETLPLGLYASAVTTRRRTVWHRVDPARLHAQLAKGATLVLDSVDEIHRPIAAAATELERWLRTSVQVNVYASLSERPGFGLHWDDHDVVVLQLDGAKHWTIHEPTRTAPLHRDVVAPDVPTGPPVAELVLQAGDILYLPRGWWHCVSASEGTPSLHATFGLTTTTGAQLVEWVADELRSDPTFRLDLPVHGSAAEQRAHLAKLRDRIAETFADPQLVAHFIEARDGLDVKRLRPSLPFIEEVPPNPRLRARLLTTRARMDLSQDEHGTVIFRACGDEWDFDARARPLLQLLIEAGRSPVTIHELSCRSGLSLEDVASAISALVARQAATVEGAAR